MELKILKIKSLLQYDEVIENITEMEKQYFLNNSVFPKTSVEVKIENEEGVKTSITKTIYCKWINGSICYYNMLNFDEEYILVDDATEIIKKKITLFKEVEAEFFNIGENSKDFENCIKNNENKLNTIVFKFDDDTFLSGYIYKAYKEKGKYKYIIFYSEGKRYLIEIVPHKWYDIFSSIIR